MRAASARATSRRSSKRSSASRRSAAISSVLADLLQAPARQASTLEVVEHRPWALPQEPWVMGQTWDDLLFAHYRVPAELLRQHVPAGLRVQEHSGSGWLGVTPFAVTGLRARGLPAFPFVSSFLELNVRTYVTRDDKPGIWFFSLDSSSELAVVAARRLYRLPYYKAEISITSTAAGIVYECRRAAGTAFSGTYSPTGPVAHATSGSLEHFLTERYCLYAEHEGTLYRAEIHHEPWPLQPAEVEIRVNTMPPDDFSLGDEPLLHFARRQDVVIWPLLAV